MAKLIGDVELYLWDGGCAFFGSSEARTRLHSHQAIQFAFGMGGNVRLSPTARTAVFPTWSRIYRKAPRGLTSGVRCLKECQALPQTSGAHCPNGMRPRGR